MKIHPVGAELFHAGGRAAGRTDRAKLTVAFRNFANASKNIHESNIYRNYTQQTLFLSPTISDPMPMSNFEISCFVIQGLESVQL
jgi:hypothetical protein